MATLSPMLDREIVCLCSNALEISSLVTASVHEFPACSANPDHAMAQ
jgi:hypothetical protein